MKKIFTFAAAVLASFSLWAAVTVPAGTLNPANVPAEGWAGKYAPAYIENGDWVCFSPYEIYQSTQTWAAKDASGSTDGSWDAMPPFPAQSEWTTNDGKVATVRQDQKGPYYYRITNTTEVAALVKSGSNKKRTVFLEAYELNEGAAPETATLSTSMESSTMAAITLTDLDSQKEYLIVVRAEDTGSGGSSSGNSNYYAIGFKTIISTDPTISVSPANVTLAATAKAPTVTETVTFTGKYLTAGTYNLTTPTVADLTIAPTSVTVGEDGKLNAEITLTYAPQSDVEAATAKLGLIIGELNKEVTINYSADLTAEKKYIAASFNIEQLVLDNGTKYDIKAAFDAANIEYDRIDALDTLNDLEDKANRNYAFLGLKLKTANAYVAGWLKAGSTIRVKFGNIGDPIKVIIGGYEQEFSKDQLVAPLEYTANEDTYLQIVTTSKNTVVIKQIMLDEQIAEVVLPEPNAYLITVGEFEHGTVTASWDNKKYRTPVGALVTLTYKADAGYRTYRLAYNGIALHDDDKAGFVTFTMPAEDVTIEAEFLANFPTAVENTEAEMKAVKVIRNGQLFIEKNGNLYNAQGAIVK